MSRSARRREQHELAGELRGRGLCTAEVARMLRDRYGLDARLAARTACGWSQADTAREWTARWPDDPKTFKNVSYWENWPSPTGHAPSLAVLDRLAQLYRCDVADLVAGWGEHGPPPDAAAPLPAEPESLAWQVEHLDLHELTRAMADWAQRIPVHQRHALLLKLGTAASLAASSSDPGAVPARRMSAGARSLAGRWSSTYGYRSTSRDAEFEGDHTVELAPDGGRLIGRSLPHPSGSELELVLTAEGSVLSGTWTERTSPSGHYRAATFHGIVHLVVDPTGHSMNGMWLGVSKRYAIKSGVWRLDRVPAAIGEPVTTATTTEGGAISASATSENSANSILPT